MNESEIGALLDATRIGRLSMASTDLRPYCVPLPFCWTDGALYLRLPLTGRKGRTLVANDRVCFEVDTYTDTLDDYASVLVEGRLVPVTDLGEKQHVKRTNDEKYDRLRRGFRPGHGRPTDLSQLPLRKIVVEHMTGLKRQPAPGAPPAAAATFATSAAG